MRRAWIVVAAVAMAGAAVLAFAGGSDAKLPKCSMTMCRAVNCSPDVLCASGAHVKSCAEVCNN